MQQAEVVALLSEKLPSGLAADLVGQFLELRQDTTLGTLGRASPGKFVESVVQALQFLERGSFDDRPDVDRYLRGLEDRPAAIDDGLRVCAARIARAMYTLRNKRNILHKGPVDLNRYDLRFLFGSCQWVLAELLRQCAETRMEEAGRAIAMVQAPVHEVVEVVGTKRLVVGQFSLKDELLVLLASHYPEAVTTSSILESMDRRHPAAVRKALSTLWEGKLVEKVNRGRYVLTPSGKRAGDQISVTPSQS